MLIQPLSYSISYLCVTLGSAVLHSSLSGNQGSWLCSKPRPVPKGPGTSLIPVNPLSLDLNAAWFTSGSDQKFLLCMDKLLDDDNTLPYFIIDLLPNAPLLLYPRMQIEMLI